MTQDVIQVTEDTKITHIAGLMQPKPQHRRDDEEGMRVEIIRYRAADPEAVVATLKSAGYRLMSENLPEG